MQTDVGQGCSPEARRGQHSTPYAETTRLDDRCAAAMTVTLFFASVVDREWIFDLILSGLHPAAPHQKHHG